MDGLILGLVLVTVFLILVLGIVVIICFICALGLIYWPLDLINKENKNENK